MDKILKNIGSHMANVVKGCVKACYIMNLYKSFSVQNQFRTGTTPDRFVYLVILVKSGQIWSSVKTVSVESSISSGSGTVICA